MDTISDLKTNTTVESHYCGGTDTLKVTKINGNSIRGSIEFVTVSKYEKGKKLKYPNSYIKKGLKRGYMKITNKEE